MGGTWTADRNGTSDGVGCLPRDVMSRPGPADRPGSGRGRAVLPDDEPDAAPGRTSEPPLPLVGDVVPVPLKDERSQTCL